MIYVSLYVTFSSPCPFPTLWALYVLPNNETVNFSHEVFVVGKYFCVKYQIITNSVHILTLYEEELTLITTLFTVEPPSDLKFKILNENTVEMTWRHPTSQIHGYRILVDSDTGESSS